MNTRTRTKANSPAFQSRSKSNWVASLNERANVPPSVTAIPAGSREEVTVEPQDGPAERACALCTYLNSLSAIVCAMCETPLLDEALLARADEYLSIPESIAEEGDKVMAIWGFDAPEEGDLAFEQGAYIALIQAREDTNWWRGRYEGRTGRFPKTYVKRIPVEGAEGGTGSGVILIGDRGAARTIEDGTTEVDDGFWEEEKAEEEKHEEGEVDDAPTTTEEKTGSGKKGRLDRAGEYEGYHIALDCSGSAEQGPPRMPVSVDPVAHFSAGDTLVDDVVASPETRRRSKGKKGEPRMQSKHRSSKKKKKKKREERKGESSTSSDVAATSAAAGEKNGAGVPQQRGGFRRSGSKKSKKKGQRKSSERSKKVATDSVPVPLPDSSDGPVSTI